jgi:K+-transporting ATPase KdpF subunit
MTPLLVIASLLVVGLLAYLVYALLFPERLS